MTPADWMFDAALALTLPVLSWRALGSDELREAVVLFIAFGLFSALAWSRLDAPDIALVEAAVGAGLSGVLMMSALGWISTSGAKLRRRPRTASVLLPLGVGACLFAAVVTLSEPRPGVQPLVLDRLGQSGASHPVTAVLLNFRGYDTLLEVIVLVAVAIAIRLLFPAIRAPSDSIELAGPLLLPLVHWLLPVFVVTAGFLVWMGSHAPGGAFQAGAILAGGSVLLLLSRPSWPPARARAVLAAALVVGPILFLGIGAATLLWGENLIEYPPDHASTWILVLESALTLSIAVSLLMFFPRPLPAAPRGAGKDPEQVS